ncbi:MAG: asparagine synthase-related protein, partial [Candidatus Binatia bacterium]
KGLLGDRLLKLADNHKRDCANAGRDDLLADLLAYERKTYFVGEYLTKVDGATMYYGLEARSPFLDHCLWEFASSLPFGLRLRRGYLKSILRELARRRIGPGVAWRRKRGFGVPVHRWITGQWRAQLETTLRDSILDQENWVRKESALAELELAAHRGDAPQQLWYIFVLESWLRHQRNEIADTPSRTQGSLAS